MLDHVTPSAAVADTLNDSGAYAVSHADLCPRQLARMQKFLNVVYILFRKFGLASLRPSWYLFGVTPSPMIIPSFSSATVARDVPSLANGIKYVFACGSGEQVAGSHARRVIAFVATLHSWSERTVFLLIGPAVSICKELLGAARPTADKESSIPLRELYTGPYPTTTKLWGVFGYGPLSIYESLKPNRSRNRYIASPLSLHDSSIRLKWLCSQTGACFA